MDQVIQAVAQKAGISQDQARTAVTTVINLLKTKLPKEFAGQIDAAMNGSFAGGDLTKDAENLMGGAFGKK
jgi:hypothetical protein